ncbi:U6 small nuclear RNA (adenine-(43)-N(6))-methyltransferase-like [Homalodisca vitripennis]|uniref:U6 small nuclear RNA (adenine-(43)-N(6))-methyltransferase-like n=1 Tax=Homalodisca vitripennis TaxID=197043 RepID=UPI001EEAED77|nr:U6 small nuclear RNA (adenine-(43)-N(6))-methyltransferase-like [Homalodisca vitripennis]
MSLNKFMHPRNVYRKPPDFKALAIKYPEFRKYAKQEISGKVSIDFKNKESLRALTSTLLKEDFGLDVEIPLNRLIPTLPLRLNYLLWIEDILAANRKTSDIVKGIDIGCGASCVYPLLAAKHFQWQMLGTEVDEESVLIASNNVTRNGLSDRITIQKTPERTMLDGVLEADTVYDFCVCNPPFFSSEEELEPQNVARSPSRPPPRNAMTGASWELVTPGGEVAFVESIIQDSLKLKDKVRVYSVMLGHKTSVGKILAALKKPEVQKVTSYKFCQGRTTRWGIAWTLTPSVTLPAVKQQPLQKPKSLPFSHMFDTDMKQTLEVLRQLMVKLQITYSVRKNSDEICGMEITALANTWTNSRRKRREEKRKQAVSKSENNNTELKPEDSQSVGPEVCENEREEIEEKVQIDVCDKISENGSPKSEEVERNPDLVTENEIARVGTKRTCDEDAKCSNNPKRVKVENSKAASKTEPYFIGLLLLEQKSFGTEMELSWIRGSGGRDSAHQLLQYFKNNIKCYE